MGYYFLPTKDIIIFIFFGLVSYNFPFLSLSPETSLEAVAGAECISSAVTV